LRKFFFLRREGKGRLGEEKSKRKIDGTKNGLPKGVKEIFSTSLCRGRTAKTKGKAPGTKKSGCGEKKKTQALATFRNQFNESAEGERINSNVPNISVCTGKT